MPRKKPSKKSPSKAPKRAVPDTTKSDFIRRYPDLSAGKVAALAAKAGIEMDSGLVYVVRSYDRKRATKAEDKVPKDKPHQVTGQIPMEEFWNVVRPGRGTAAKSQSLPTKQPKDKPMQESSPKVLTSEEHFVRLILELGVARATALFKETLSKVRSLTS